MSTAMHMLRKRKEPGADAWDTGFRTLLEQGVITGYGLIVAGACQVAEGEVTHLFANPDTHTCQLSEIFRGPEYPTSIDVCGDKLMVVKKGPADAFALGRKRALGVCLNNSPFGIIVSTFRSSGHPHLVIPQVEMCCRAVRV
eukprot:jgi/Botrbrau1/9698/Bobra.0201s0028.1